MNSRAQSMLEYTMVIGVVVALLMSMTIMLKRGAQSMIKTVADQVGSQINSDQDFDPQTGWMNSTIDITKGSNTRKIREQVGDVNYMTHQATRKHTTKEENLGYQATEE
ncbi:MAG: hypothetical protein HQL23_08420 [Candidatus Omnitrophica bacterium]|nr:hypothetical protein [Candidatus Omnitrophota bacterium]